MGNNGFVTGSDTEKELKAWQTARETPIDEEKLRQQYKNRQNNAQGQHFEREILAGCKMYQQHGIAAIDKTPEPFRVSKKSRNGIFTGRFSTPAQPDFQGTLHGGRSIVFEAKRTSKDRITRNVLTDTQMDVLEKHNRLGALCGVCVNIKDDFFFIPWNVWRDMKEMYGRQYLKAEDIGKYKVRFDGAVHFLDKLIKEIIYKKTAGAGRSDRALDNIEGQHFMKIYISGKIAGDSGYIEKFKAAEKEIRQQYRGCEVINPAIILQTMPESTTHAEYMKISLCLLDMCDAVYMLPDWKESKGAYMEYHRAFDMGYEIMGCSV